MAEITVRIPNVAQIIVVGPVGCGKSIVMDRICKAIQLEFGATVLSDDLRQERNANDLDNLTHHEKQMVESTTWLLTEKVQ